MGDLSLPFVLPSIKNKALEARKYKNFLAALANRRSNKVLLRSKPFDITMDVTTSCQLHCPYCAVGNGTMVRQRQVVKPEMFDRATAGFKDEAFLIWYFSAGEPLLHKEFPELVARTKDAEMFSVISTNLSLKLSKERLEKTLLSGLGMISVSLDGATRETYSQYRRGGDFDLVVDNLRWLAERKKELGLEYPLLEWRFLRFRHNEHEEALARSLAQEWGLDLIEFFPGSAPEEGHPHADGVFATHSPPVGPAISGPALDQGILSRRQTGLLAQAVPGLASSRVVGDIKDKKCDWLYYGSMIYPDGAVGPCCVAVDASDDFSDLTKVVDFAEAFNSPLHVASRQMFKSGETAKTVCDRCPLPGAQHYQFATRVRGILRNAPDWAVAILAEDPEAFFFPVDREMLPEVAALFDGSVPLHGSKAGDSIRGEVLALTE